MRVTTRALAGCGLVFSLLGVAAGAAAARPSFGVEIGAGWSSLSAGETFGSSDPAWRGGMHGGFRLGQPLRGRLQFVTGLHGYRRAYGDRNTLTISVSDGLPPDPDSRFTLTATEDVDLDGVAVPVRLDWRPLPGTGLRVGVGGEVGYLLRAWSHGVALSTADLPLVTARARVIPLGVTADIFEDVFSARDATSEFERWRGAVTAGAGYDLAVAGHRLTLDARFHQGLTDVRQRGASERRLRVLELGLGVWF